MMYKEKSAAPLLLFLSLCFGVLVGVGMRLFSATWPIVALVAIAAACVLFLALACCWVGRGP